MIKISEITPQIDGKMSNELATLLKSLVDDIKTLNTEITCLKSKQQQHYEDTSHTIRYGL